ncbi:MAG TPA: RNA-binding protein [Cyanobacteria bacterium UBA8156]|jgi:spoIIIJ-associated protein|nr:RNA-binding protein [Cyanobacteria bacterium UBA8156]
MVVEAAQTWLTELLARMGMGTGVKVLPHTPDIWLEIDSVDLSPLQVTALLGEDGATLDAIQHLLNATIAVQFPDSPPAFSVELNGYRARRQAELEVLTQQAIAQVRSTGEPYSLENLSAADRRLVHLWVSEAADLETFSTGKEPHRILVIQPASLSP